MAHVDSVYQLLAEARQLYGCSTKEMTAVSEEIAGVVNCLSVVKQRILDADMRSRMSFADSYDSQYITEIDTIQTRFNKSLFDLVNNYTNEIEETVRLYKGGAKLNASEYRRNVANYIEEVNENVT